MKSKLIIWGASGHARVVADILRLRDNYETIGFIDDIDSSRHGTLFCGLPVLGGREQLDALRIRGIASIVIAVGNCEKRLELADAARNKGFVLATAIHPRSTIAADVTIGSGSVVAAGAVINPGTVIGENVIINTAASVDHDCVLSDGVHVCPGVTIGGSVTAGRAAWIGIGSTVKDHIHIGAGVVIGAGSVVVRDVPDAAVAYGVPAKVKRENSAK